MSENEKKFQDYVTFPRTFEQYKWYKPLITIVLVIILYFIFQIVLAVVFGAIYGNNVLDSVLNGGYETLNTSDVSVYFSYLSIAIFIPIIYIASKIVHDRPFSSYASSRGGWNWKIYFKCLFIPLAIYLVFSMISILGGNESGSRSQVSVIALILSSILIPIQCIGEEFAFRGLLMQSLGSWSKIPILAIIAQAVIFAVVHPYNILGVINIAVSGIVYGLLAWRTNGLEAGAAIHSINNLMAFYTVALGLSSISSAVSFWDFLSDLLITLVTAIAVYYIGNKKGWFDEETPESKLF
jgi:membrane protease YdiL (CAAX protease family)